VVDFATRALGMPETNYYQEFHRVYGHGLPAALVIAAVVAVFAQSRVRAALCAFAAVHLHFVCDILGSRGNGAEDLWGIAYLSPLSDKPAFEWAGQWPLVGWQNMLVTALLLLWVFARALRTGYTPLRLVSARADAELVAVLRKRFGSHKDPAD
jgi:hypothetical protein